MIWNGSAWHSTTINAGGGGPLAAGSIAAGGGERLGFEWERLHFLCIRSDYHQAVSGINLSARQLRPVIVTQEARHQQG
ncbi:MAG: hypothetical protein IPL23_10760 [Saprospiraceae bacterium]|nr:hypothetical protein [Saprospiraceae bacterium]